MCRLQQQEEGELMAALNIETVLLHPPISRCVSLGTHNACPADRIVGGWTLLTFAWGVDHTAWNVEDII